MGDQRLTGVTLDERSIVRWNPDIEHERKVAIYDLLEQNYFAPKREEGARARGPFHLELRIEENRLAFDITRETGEAVDIVRLSLATFRRVIREYFTVCDSYFNAIKTLSPSRIEAIDMGRRSLHDQGSELLRERLGARVEIDFHTARRLFTLVCVVTLRR